MPGSWVASCDIAGVASAVATIAAAPSSISFVIAHSPSQYESERARGDAGSRDRLHGAVNFEGDRLHVARKRKGRRALRHRPSLATAGSEGPVPLRFHA